MYLDSITEWVADEKASPRRWPAILDRNIRCLQSRSQGLHVCALKAKMAGFIRVLTMLSNGHMNVESQVTTRVGPGVRSQIAT